MASAFSFSRGSLNPTMRSGAERRPWLAACREGCLKDGRGAERGAKARDGQGAWINANAISVEGMTSFMIGVWTLMGTKTMLCFEALEMSLDLNCFEGRDSMRFRSDGEI